jgi:hypothetical protein
MCIQTLRGAGREGQSEVRQPTITPRYAGVKAAGGKITYRVLCVLTKEEACE